MPTPEIERIPGDAELSRLFWDQPDASPLTHLQFPYENGARAESFIWRKYAPAIDDVHQRGCAIQTESNPTRIAKSQAARNYIGSRTVVAQRLRSIRKRDYIVTVEHRPEPSDQAHSEVRWSRLDGKPIEERMPKSDKAALRLAILEALGDLESHRCPE